MYTRCPHDTRATRVRLVDEFVQPFRLRWRRRASGRRSVPWRRRTRRASPPPTRDRAVASVVAWRVVAERLQQFSARARRRRGWGAGAPTPSRRPGTRSPPAPGKAVACASRSSSVNTPPRDGDRGDDSLRDGPAVEPSLAPCAARRRNVARELGVGRTPRPRTARGRRRATSMHGGAGRAEEILLRAPQLRGDRGDGRPASASSMAGARTSARVSLPTHGARRRLPKPRRAGDDDAQRVGGRRDLRAPRGRASAQRSRVRAAGSAPPPGRR